MANCNASEPAPATSSLSSSSSSGREATTLAACVARLSQMERLLRTQERQLRERDSEVARLRRENRQMHRFLADYGMEWVGDEEDGEAGGGAAAGGKAAAGSTSTTSTAVATATKASPKLAPAAVSAEPAAAPDMERVRKAVAELNDLASTSTGGGEVVKRPDGSHAFSGAHAALTLTFWRDGMQARALLLMAPT